jgi:hypothetical protein
MKINLFPRTGISHIEIAPLKNSLRMLLVAAALTVLLTSAGCGGGSIPIGDTGVSITDVVLDDRFPPDCEDSSPMCTVAGQGYQYLTIWLESDDSADALAALGAAIYVTDSAGERYNLGGGLQSGSYFVAQKVPASASGFTLYVSGVDPIDLGK